MKNKYLSTSRYQCYWKYRCNFRIFLLGCCHSLKRAMLLKYHIPLGNINSYNTGSLAQFTVYKLFLQIPFSLCSKLLATMQDYIANMTGLITRFFLQPCLCLMKWLMKWHASQLGRWHLISMLLGTVHFLLQG